MSTTNHYSSSIPSHPSIHPSTAAAAVLSPPSHPSSTRHPSASYPRHYPVNHPRLFHHCPSLLPPSPLLRLNYLATSIPSTLSTLILWSLTPLPSHLLPLLLILSSSPVRLRTLSTLQPLLHSHPPDRSSSLLLAGPSLATEIERQKRTARAAHPHTRLASNTRRVRQVCLECSIETLSTLIGADIQL